MSSSTTNSSFLIPNIANPVTIKLVAANYLLQCILFLQIRRIHSMSVHLDDSSLCLAPTTFFIFCHRKPNYSIKPNQFSLWGLDPKRLCATWIHATLSQSIFGQVVGLQTSREVWLCIERLHAIQPYELSLRGQATSKEIGCSCYCSQLRLNAVHRRWFYEPRLRLQIYQITPYLGTTVVVTRLL